MMMVKKYREFVKENYEQKVSCWDLQDEVLSLHHTKEDFEDGDILDRIANYDYYILKDVDISDIDIDEFYIDYDLVDKYKDEYLRDKNYPPVILNDDLSIIDGTHRLNALDELNIKTARAYVGILDSEEDSWDI